jgi:ribosomal protein S18 acetylase RimI-like enzyme
LTEPPDKSVFLSEPLEACHDRAAFVCESPALERYLKTQARQDVEKRLAAVFVLTPDSKTVAGYYSLSQFSVQAERIPGEIRRKLTRYQEIPVTLIGRLARSTEFRRQGIGELLLMDALRRCHLHAKEIGSWAVLVEAKDNHAVAFYKKYGFLEIQGHPSRLFLPMQTISRLLAEG